MITGRSIASPVIQHLKNPSNGHQTATILVSPQWTFGGIYCGSPKASTLCPACPGLCVALARLAPQKNFSNTKVSLGVFRFFREPPVKLSGFFFVLLDARQWTSLLGKVAHCMFFTRHHSPCQLIHQHTMCSAVIVQYVFFFYWMLKGTKPAAFSVNPLPSSSFLPSIEWSILGPALQNWKGRWVISIHVKSSVLASFQSMS